MVCFLNTSFRIHSEDLRELLMLLVILLLAFTVQGTVVALITGSGAPNSRPKCRGNTTSTSCCYACPARRQASPWRPPNVRCGQFFSSQRDQSPVAAMCTWLTALGVIVFCAIKARPLKRCQKANLHSKDSKATSPANDLPASAAAALDAAMSRTEYSDYRAVRRLGRGTHSTVVLLESTKNGDLVACKRTPLDATAGAVAAQVDQVEREISVLRMCAHQNIVAFRHVSWHGSNLDESLA